MLEIRTVGDDVLRRKAKAVRRVNNKVQMLIHDMVETMYDADGIGLAAPQVGVSVRIVVADVGEGLVQLVNPEILWKDGVQRGFEGCLSIPGLIGEVERAQNIRVTGLDVHGRETWVECDGLMARCLQHEIDHLDGILFTDLALKIMPRESEEVDSDEVVLD